MSERERERERERHTRSHTQRRGKKIARFNEKSLILLNFHFEKYLRRHSSREMGTEEEGGGKARDVVRRELVAGPWPWLTKSHVKTHKNNMREPAKRDTQ